MKKNRISLKFWTIKAFYFEKKCEAQILIDTLFEVEELQRNWDYSTWRREKRNDTCMELCIKALEKAPKGTTYRNARNDKVLTKKQAIDYIKNYYN